MYKQSLLLTSISISFIFLMQWISDIFYLLVPAASTAAAFIALFFGRAGLARSYYRTSPGPEFHWRLVDHMRGHTND